MGEGFDRPGCTRPLRLECRLGKFACGVDCGTIIPHPRDRDSVAAFDPRLYRSDCNLDRMMSNIARVLSVPSGPVKFLWIVMFDLRVYIW